MKNPLSFVRDLGGRLVRSAVSAERQRAQIELERRVRPLSVFSLVEGVLGLLSLRSAASRQSWLSYLMGLALLFAACGHAFLDIRDRKTLELLSQRLSN